MMQPIAGTIIFYDLSKIRRYMATDGSIDEKIIIQDLRADGYRFSKVRGNHTWKNGIQRSYCPVMEVKSDRKSSKKSFEYA